jgi:hypothetical protein
MEINSDQFTVKRVALACAEIRQSFRVLLCLFYELFPPEMLK